MNTKKIVFSFGLLLLSCNILFAQTSNVRKAKSSYARYEELGGAQAGELAVKFLKDAIAPIDAAVEHEKTKEDAEAWTIYSLIYSNLAFAEKNEDYASKAISGVEKATALDTDGKNKDNIELVKVHLRNHYQTVGYDDWQKEDFKGAYESFEKGLQVIPGDTTLLYFGAVAAIQNKDYPNAIKKYEQILPVKEYSEHKTISADLPKLYLTVGDTTKALEYAAKAAQEYADDNDIVTQNIELNLISGNEDKIIKDIETQIQKDPKNKTLHYYLGIAYSSVNNDEKSLEAYRNALAIDPDYIEANLNAAAAIMNINNQKLMALNEDKGLPAADYNAKRDEIVAKMGEAVPYLEKATTLDPSNRNALRNLKSYYDFVQDEAKAAEVQAKLDALN